MIRKTLIFSLSILFVVALAACGSTPAATESSAGTVDTVAEETTAEDTVAEDTVDEDTVDEDTVGEETVAEGTAEPVEEAASDDAAEAATYTVDSEASAVTWYGSKPIGSSESGTVGIADGQLNFAGEQLVDGTIVIDMTSIETDSQSGNMANNLVGHLASDDFFGVETHPIATLVLKSAEPTDADNQYLVTADLTIKEITKEIEFIADATANDGTITASADIVVNRADFDVRYGSGSFFDDLGDDLISDEMEMTVSLVANS